MDINILGNTTPSPVQSIPVPPQAPASSVSQSAAPATDSAASGSAPTTPPTTQQVQQAVDNINASLKANGNDQSVQFAIDPNSKLVVVQVVDPKTNTVIRQVPTQEIIHMGMMLGQKLGQVINQEA